MNKAILCGLITLAAGLTACHSGGGGNKGGSTLPGAEGVWMEKDEAEELRTTGKLASLCPEVKKDPDTMIINVRLIDKNGGTYMYNPRVGLIPEAKMGTLSPSGRLDLTPVFQKQMGKLGQFQVSIKDGVMIFSVSGMTMEYLRSSKEEAEKYFVAQEACKTAP